MTRSFDQEPKTHGIRRSDVMRLLAAGARKLILKLVSCHGPAPITIIIITIIMAALCNRAGHYIFVLRSLLSIFYLLLFSSLILSRRRLDAYHTSTHGVALVRI